MDGIEKNMRLLLIMLVALFNASALLAQNTIHIPRDAATIQGGIDLAKNGDTVLVAPGTYNENIDFKGKNITVTSGATSFAGASSTIINAGGDGPVVTFDSGESADAILNGFTIQGGKTDVATCTYGGGIYVSGASPTIENNIVTNNLYGIYAANGSSLLIQGNDIKGNSYSDAGSTSCHTMSGVTGVGRGILLESTTDPQIIGNVIEDNKTQIAAPFGGQPSEGDGIVIDRAQSVLIKNNIIRNNQADGEAAISGTLEYMVFQNLTIVQNLIYGNYSSYESSPYTGDQIFISGSYQSSTKPTLTEINNTIYGGEFLVYSFAPSIVENNIFANLFPGPEGPVAYNNGLMCGDPESLASPLTIQNNDIVGGVPTANYGCNLGSNNLSTDPNFRDPANSDFHEQETSPTVAAGDLNAPDIPNADLDNKARTVCNTIDMGAYELRPAPPVTLSSSANPTPGGSPITFTATVTGNCNVPTGTLTFYDGSTSIGAASLNSSASASLTTSLLVVGQHKITAQYSGDFNFESSTSDVLLQTITGDPTTTILSVSPNPATALSPITLSSRVTSQYGTPTGSITFTAGGSTIATAALNASGQATATTSTLGAGTYQIVAHYTADTRFQPSNSLAVQEVVVGANSATALTATPNPSALTQAVTFTTTVRAVQGTAVPTGQVSFMDGSTLLGTVALNAAGVTSLTTSSLSFGTHTITARYGGSNNFNPSSATIAQSVALIGTSLTLTATPNPANTGQAVTLTATATSALAGMLPVGTVSFYDGSSVIGTADLGANGTATFNTSSLSAGTHILHAVLPATAYFAGSTSANVSEVIQVYDFSLSLSKTSLTMPSGDYSNISVTITPIGGFKGDVSLSCNGLPDYAICAFPDDSSVSLANDAKTIPLSVNASDVYGYGTRVSQSKAPSSGKKPKTALALLLLSAFGFARRRRKYARLFGMMGIVIVCVLGACLMNGCGDKQPGKAAPGVYMVSVVGTSTDGANLKHTVPLQLTVTK